MFWYIPIYIHIIEDFVCQNRRFTIHYYTLLYRVAHKFCFIYREPYFRQVLLFIPNTFTKHVLNTTNTVLP